MTVSIPNAKLRTRRRWILGALLGWTFGGFIPALLMLFVALLKTPALSLVTVAYFAGIVALGRILPRLVERRGALRVDDKGVFLDGRELAKRSKLTHGHVVRVGEQLVLRLVPRGARTPIDIEVADEAQATALLVALRLDRTVAEYAMRAHHAKDGPRRVGLRFVLSLVFAFTGMLSAAVLIPSAAFGWQALYALIPLAFWAAGMFGSIATAVSRDVFVSVGEDGLWLRQPLVQKRYLSFRELSAVEHAGRDVTLTLVDGTAVVFHHPAEGAEDTADLARRIRAGIASFAGAPKRTGDAVARNGRSIAAWIASASKTHERSANYRAAVVPQDELWRIVEDASASASERAGAALALRADLDHDGKTRLRVAAGACAETRLRVALESVVASDDAALAAALEPLEEPTARRRRLP